MLDQQLRVPGPTPLPARVVRAASQPMINHRGPEFAALLEDVVSGLRWALRTANDVLLFPASGTGGLEAAVVNVLSPGERALFCTMGSFGDRWANLADAYGVDVVRLAVEPGEAIDPEDVDRILAEHPAIQTVFVTHNETSTGVSNDLPALAAVIKGRGQLPCVDSVSGAGTSQRHGHRRAQPDRLGRLPQAVSDALAHALRTGPRGWTGFLERQDLPRRSSRDDR